MNSALAASLLVIVVLFVVSGPKNVSAVVGGSPAYPGEFPYQVSLRNWNFGHICGGAILSPNLIVTAGACTDPRSPEINSIVAGTLHRAQTFPGEQVRGAGRIVSHAGYDGFHPYDDLALIFLDSPLVFNQYISNISLPVGGAGGNQSTYPDGVIYSGWGSEQYGLPLADFLLKVTLDTYSDEYCAAWFDQVVPDRILCTGRNETGFGGCQGDAGTPIVNPAPFGGGAPYLAAVSSHFPCSGACCGIPGPTEASPELTFYVDWILEQSRIYGGGL